MKTNCLLPFQRIKIDSDGGYQSCCHQSAWYGNVLDESFDVLNLYKHTIAKAVQDKSINNKLHDICNNEKCPVYHTDKKSNIEFDSKLYPTEIELALPPIWCNIGGLNPTPDTACFMCPRADENFEDIFDQNDYTDEIVEKIKPAMPYVKSLSILGLAEPFWQGKIFDVFDKLEFKKYKEKSYFWTFTNGQLFIEKYQNKFLDYVDSHSLAFSVDAATPETYKKIRKSNFDMYEQTWKNIESYFKKVQNRSNVTSHITSNINLINLQEMPDIIKKANGIGVPKVQFILTHSTTGKTPVETEYSYTMCNGENWEEFWDMQLLSEELGKKLNIETQFYVPFHRGYKN